MGIKLTDPDDAVRFIVTCYWPIPPQYNVVITGLDPDDADMFVSDVDDETGTVTITDIAPEEP